MSVWVTRETIPHLYNSFSSRIITKHVDEEGYYHNDDGPAIICEDSVYFAHHGVDWTNEQYKKYILKTVKSLLPEEPIKTLPFSQLESIILTHNNWGHRKLLLSEPVNILGEDNTKI